MYICTKNIKKNYKYEKANIFTLSSKAKNISLSTCPLRVASYRFTSPSIIQFAKAIAVFQFGYVCSILYIYISGNYFKLYFVCLHKICKIQEKGTINHFFKTTTDCYTNQPLFNERGCVLFLE